jgi:hypothetical protein
MRYVILRDDDTNALTPEAALETLYRPFLERGLPVNLAAIPEVDTQAKTPAGEPEGFLPAGCSWPDRYVPLAENRALTGYLASNPGYHIVQHGCHHDCFEFDRPERADVVRRLERGAEQLRLAGFQPGAAFVAPHDKFSPLAYEEVARRFPVISSGWFEWRRLPRAWRWRYLGKKAGRRPHWRVSGSLLLSHPGCLLSYARPPDAILPSIQKTVAGQELTVLVTHWWEYFRDGAPNVPFIRVLHETAAWLAEQPDVRVISFAELAARNPAGKDRARRAEVARGPG